MELVIYGKHVNTRNMYPVDMDNMVLVKQYNTGHKVTTIPLYKIKDAQRLVDLFNKKMKSDGWCFELRKSDGSIVNKKEYRQFMLVKAIDGDNKCEWMNHYLRAEV